MARTPRTRKLTIAGVFLLILGLVGKAAIDNGVAVWIKKLFGEDSKPAIAVGRDNIKNETHIGQLNVGQLGDTINLNSYFDLRRIGVQRREQEPFVRDGHQGGVSIRVENLPTVQNSPTQLPDGPGVATRPAPGGQGTQFSSRIDGDVTEFRIEGRPTAGSSFGPENELAGVAQGHGDVTGPREESSLPEDEPSPVMWSIDEPNCGSITQDGRYTPPPPSQEARTCHVRVTSKERPSASGVAAMLVPAAK